MKQEVETGYRTLCSTCLSSDRNLISVNCNEQVHEVFSILMYDFAAERVSDSISDTEQLICWECVALMRRFGRFKRQVHSAQQHLGIMALNPEQETHNDQYLSHSLSPLEVVTRVDYDKILFDYSTRDQWLLTEEESVKSENDVKIEIDLDHRDLDSSEMPQLEISSEDPLASPTVSFANLPAPQLPVRQRTAKTTGRGGLKSGMQASVSKPPKFAITDNKLKTVIAQAKPEEDVKKVGYVTTFMSEEQMLAAREEDKQRVQYASSGYKCELCVVGFLTQDQVKDHFKTMHRLKEGFVACRVCSAYMPEARLRSHVASHYYRHTCNECGHGSYSAFAMASHVKSHVAKPSTKAIPRRYKCKKCPKIFKLKVLLREHLDYHHEKKYKFICQECDKHFVRKEILDKHIIRVHRNNRPDLPKKHVCELCSQAFTTRKGLVYHVRTHTGARPHACALCAARFAQESPLVTHLRGVHGRKGGFRELLNKYMRAGSED